MSSYLLIYGRPASPACITCCDDYIIRDYYLKKLFIAQNSAVLLHRSYVSGNQSLLLFHDFSSTYTYKLSCMYQSAGSYFENHVFQHAFFPTDYLYTEQLYKDYCSV